MSHLSSWTSYHWAKSINYKDSKLLYVSLWNDKFNVKLNLISISYLVFHKFILYFKCNWIRYWNKSCLSLFWCLCENSLLRALTHSICSNVVVNSSLWLIDMHFSTFSSLFYSFMAIFAMHRPTNQPILSRTRFFFCS